MNPKVRGINAFVNRLDVLLCLFSYPLVSAVLCLINGFLLPRLNVVEQSGLLRLKHLNS